MIKNLFLLFILLAFPANAAFLKGGGPSGVVSLVLPGTPQVVYSVLKYNGWSGAAINIKRTSDSTSEDVGFGANNYIDASAISSFCNATTCTVEKWYDQSGNGFDATDVNGHPPIIRTANSYLGLQPITFVAPGGSSTVTNLTMPVGVTVSRQAYTAAMATIYGGGLVNGFSYFGLGTDATFTNNVTHLYDNAGGVARWYDATTHISAPANKMTPQVGQSSSTILRSNSTNAIMRYNGTEYSASASSALTLTGGQLGAGSWSAATLGPNEMFAFVLYGSDVGSTNAAAIDNEFASVFKSTLSPTRQILFDGDSVSANYIVNDYILHLLRQTYPLISPNTGMFDIAISGQTMQTVYANDAKAISRYNSALTHNWSHIFAGSNDIGFAASGSIVGYGTTVFNSYLVPYIQDMESTGFEHVLVGTMLPRLWTGSSTDISQRETERLAFNTLVRNNAATYGYIVVDYASLYPLGQEANYTTGGGSVDGLHPTVTTFGNMAVILAAVINGL